METRLSLLVNRPYDADAVLLASDGSFEHVVGVESFATAGMMCVWPMDEIMQQDEQKWVSSSVWPVCCHYSQSHQDFTIIMADFVEKN